MAPFVSRFASVAVFSTLVLAGDVGAQQLRPAEAKWFERWGIEPSDRQQHDKMLKQVRVEARLPELVAAFEQDKDPIAFLLVGIHLGQRCNGGKKISLPDCAALVRWSGRNPRHSLSYAAEPFGRFTAAHGDIPARRAVEIGKVFELGIGVPVDYNAADFFYGVAGHSPDRQEVAEGYFRLGVMADLGRGFQPNPMVARMHYRSAADKGHPVASYLTALMLPKSEMNYPHKVYEYLRSAADSGVTSAAYLLAYRIEKRELPSMYLRMEDAFKYYRMAALKGHVEAIDALAGLYYNGWGVPMDERAAEKWWEKAARAGHGPAAFQIAKLHSYRNDYDGSMPWLRRAAEAGITEARTIYNQQAALGYKEKSIKGTLLGVFSAINEAAAMIEDQRRRELAFEEAVTQATFAAITKENAAKFGSASWSGRLCCIEISDDSAERAARLQEARIAGERELEAVRAESARVDAQAKKDQILRDEEWKRRRDAAAIACHGSLEAAKTAKATCQ